MLIDCEFSSQFDRVKFPPPGLDGGLAGAPARILVERAGSVQELPGKTLGFQLLAGDRVTILTQGGGGLGDPRERDPRRLRAMLPRARSRQEAALSDYESPSTAERRTS